MATHWTLGGDAADPHRLAAFWALALGYIAEPGYDYEGGASIVDPDGSGPAIGFLQVPEAKTRRTGCTSTSGWPASARGTRPSASGWSGPRRPSWSAPGRRVVREEAYDGQFGHIVMLDPEGNEFCVA